MDKKVCSKCKIEKSLEEFHKETSCVYGRRAQCIICRKEYLTRYRNENRIKINEQAKIYRTKNKEEIKGKRKIIYQNNKKYINERNRVYKKNRRKNDPLFKMKEYMRVLIGHSFKNNGYSKRTNTYKILGCGYEEFMVHLEVQFIKGMTWENYGKVWYIDHTIPSFIGNSEDDVIRLNYYENLSPMFCQENLEKNNKVPDICTLWENPFVPYKVNGVIIDPRDN